MKTEQHPTQADHRREYSAPKLQEINMADTETGALNPSEVAMLAGPTS